MVKKESTFCKLLYHRKCKRRWVDGQKKPNLVDVVCEHPPLLVYLLIYRRAYDNWYHSVENTADLAIQKKLQEAD